MAIVIHTKEHSMLHLLIQFKRLRDLQITALKFPNPQNTMARIKQELLVDLEINSLYKELRELKVLESNQHTPNDN